MRQFRHSFRWIAAVVAAVGLAFYLFGRVYDDPATLTNAAILGGYCVLVVALSCAPETAAGTVPSWPVVVASGATLAAAAVMVAQQPFLARNLMLSPILVAVLALPHLRGRLLGGLFVACFGDALLIIALGDLMVRPTALPHHAVWLLEVSALVATVGVLLQLLYLHNKRLLGLSASLQASNADLERASAELRRQQVADFHAYQQRRDE